MIFDKILLDESRSKNGKKWQNGQILWTLKAISIGKNEEDAQKFLFFVIFEIKKEKVELLVDIMGEF